MSGLLVIVPSRGRLANIDRLADAWTATGATADVIVGVDDDDPHRPGYFDVCELHPCFDLLVAPRRRLGGTLNAIAVEHADRYDYLGFMGDDHCPRTPGWDATVRAELDRHGTGIVYGNDLLQGERLPTAVFMTANIVRALGWMCPPGLTHLFLDDAWLTLGRALHAITYLPDVVIEHLHPVAGKAAEDDGYRDCNTSDLWAHDRAVFEQWRDTQIEADVSRIREATVGG